METRVCRLHGVGDLRVETEAVAGPSPGEVRVALAFGGICGSDLHYYHDGGFGPIRVKEPMILGHEASGVVEAVGSGVDALRPGDKVAINPSRPCGKCQYCAKGMFIHCLDMRFRGSAMRFPHEQGLFRDRIVLDAAQCVKVAAGVDLGELACAEPLAVCLHARNRAGDVAGKRVLVTGAGPIGVLCTAVAATGGAAEVVVSDLEDAALDIARQMGASRVVNVGDAEGALDEYTLDKGYFDIAFECSGAGAAIRTVINSVRPRGTILQVGLAGDVPVPLSLIVGKELKIVGTQRFHEEFAQAVEHIAEQRIDVRPAMSGSFPLSRADEAFQIAGDRSRAVKVHLAFGVT